MPDEPNVIPPDPSTPVGRFRFLFGDTENSNGQYEQFQDWEIKEFLSMGSDSVNRSVGYAYLALAGQAAKQSKTVKDYDLQVDLTKRANDLRLTAATWFSLADADDEAAGGADIFELHPVNPPEIRRPEASQWPYVPKVRF